MFSIYISFISKCRILIYDVTCDEKDCTTHIGKACQHKMSTVNIESSRRVRVIYNEVYDRFR